MYQRERFEIVTPEIPRTYTYVSSYRPCQVVIRDDAVLSETSAIRRELNYIKDDINEIKYRQASPTCYTIQHDDRYYQYPSYSPVIQTVTYSQVPSYHVEHRLSFVDEPAVIVSKRIRSKTPTTTYYDSYQPPYPVPYNHLERQITLNEIQRQPRLASAPAQHPRHWTPTASKNSYPHRRWNLTDYHSEP